MFLSSSVFVLRKQEYLLLCDEMKYWQFKT